jgi:hypothetical protein
MSGVKMVDGFYWGMFKEDLHIEGGQAGVVLVREGMGYLFGFGFRLTAFDFGPAPTPLLPAQWLVDVLLESADNKGQVSNDNAFQCDAGRHPAASGA